MTFPIRSPRQSVGGLFVFGRILDKIPSDQLPDLTKGLIRTQTTAKVGRGAVYKWKIIVEDETGAIAESETRRFEVK